LLEKTISISHHIEIGDVLDTIKLVNYGILCIIYVENPVFIEAYITVDDTVTLRRNESTGMDVSWWCDTYPFLLGNGTITRENNYCNSKASFR
jgi:hypothetical protein